MTPCSDTGAAEHGTARCPACGLTGAAVLRQTVLLTESALPRLRLTQYRFCGNGPCDVVNFEEGSRLLCYCFAESEAIIRHERNG